MDLDNYLTISDAARVSGITRQAVYVAIKLGKLKAVQGDDRRWLVSSFDLAIYQASKYDRLKSKDPEGNFFYCPAEGRYSIRMVAEKLKIPVQKVYYLVRIGRLKAKRVHNRTVILEEHIKECAELYSMNKILKT